MCDANDEGSDKMDMPDVYDDGGDEMDVPDVYDDVHDSTRPCICFVQPLTSFIWAVMGASKRENHATSKEEILEIYDRLIDPLRGNRNFMSWEDMTLMIESLCKWAKAELSWHLPRHP